METTVMIYMLPMMLGRTFDMGKNFPGIQIFSEEATNKNMTIEHHFTDSQYRMVDNTDDAKDILDVGGKLSLKIKSGMIDVKGEGSYLKDSSSRANSLEILVKVRFETVTQTLPSNSKPIEGWTLKNKNFLGTHFCRSITFGGDLIASVRFTSTNTYDKERIKGAIQGGIKSGSSFEADVKAQLEMLKNDAMDSTSMEIKYYATVPIPGVSYSIEGLMDVVEHFPEHVQNVNGGLGAPLKMELYPLSSIDNSFPNYMENRALNDQLDDLEEHFDDIRTTRREAGIWINSLSPYAPEKIQEKISDFVQKLDSVQWSFVKAIGDMDFSVGASTKPMSEAFTAYADGSNRLPMKYQRLFEKLKKDVYEEAPELRPKIGGATYVRWGHDECHNPSDTETVLSGVAVGTEKSQNGGSSEFICVPSTPELDNPSEIFNKYDPRTDDSSTHLKNSPLLYESSLDIFSSQNRKTMACAVCRAKERTAAFTKVAATTCPHDWNKEYDGILMAPAELNSIKGQYICVDKNMTAVSDVNFGSRTIDKVNTVQEVFMTNKFSTFDSSEENAPIPCIVCTI